MNVIAPGTSLARTLAELLCEAVSSDDRRWYLWGRPVVEKHGPVESTLAFELYTRLHVRTPAGSDPVLPRRVPAFASALAHAVPHPTVRLPVMRADWHGSCALGPDETVVLLDGLRVRVGTDTVHETDLVHLPSGAVHVTVPSVRPAASPGFLLAYGSHQPFPDHGPTTRVYVSVDDSQAASEVWAGVLEQAEKSGLVYSAKVASQPDAYPRTDAVVVYLNGASWNEALQLAHDCTALPGTAPHTSAFTRKVGPGVGIADDPRDNRPGMAALSFGQHRCLLAARALIAGGGHPDDVAQHLEREFLTAGLDPAAPERNRTPPL